MASTVASRATLCSLINLYSQPVMPLSATTVIEKARLGDGQVDTPTARSRGILASPRAACRCRSYTRSSSVLCLGMPYRDEYSNTFVSDVFGRVMISIMPRATIGTIPETIRERKLLMAISTLRTQLRRREPAANENEVSI